MTKPISVRPLWLRFMSCPGDLRNAAADAVEIDPARAAVPVHPHQEGLPAQVAGRQEAPVAAVLAIITIVAHHEIVARRDDPLALALGREIARSVTFQDGVRAARQVLDQQVGPGHLAALPLADVVPERAV